MENGFRFIKMSELDLRFKEMYQNTKKIRAMENFSISESFVDMPFLALMKHCMKISFLEDWQIEFLDRMLEKYKIKYLDLAHRTKEMKKYLKTLRPKKPSPIQQVFNLDPQETPFNIPTELLANQTRQTGLRI